MWSYYGSKTNLVDFYPKPKFKNIIEPFAGSAKYALKYFDNEITLVDKYEVVCRIWWYLQKCSSQDILKLPELKYGQTLDDFNFDCIEQRWLCSFMYSSGDQSPRNKPTKRKLIDRPKTFGTRKKDIASNLYKIQHWKIIQGDFIDLENIKATWFIDPPYQYGGEVYIESNKNINFKSLSDWCRSRNGQVIVCENTKADWMEFKPMITQRGSMKRTVEAIWSNEPTAFDHIQSSLF